MIFLKKLNFSGPRINQQKFRLIIHGTNLASTCQREYYMKKTAVSSLQVKIRLNYGQEILKIQKDGVEQWQGGLLMGGICRHYPIFEINSKKNSAGRFFCDLTSVGLLEKSIGSMKRSRWRFSCTKGENNFEIIFF